jgi:hypothetical protein
LNGEKGNSPKTNNMTLQEFYDMAVAVVKRHGISDDQTVTVMSGVYRGEIKHCAEVFIPNKIIRSGLHPNPLASITAFNDAIKFHLRTYDKETEDIDVE